MQITQGPRTKRDLLSGVKEEVQKAKLVARSTLYIEYVSGRRAIRYHDTDVVTWNLNGTITLNSGGFRTSTTKNRINEYTHARISQIDGIWYLGDGSFFYDGTVIYPDGKLFSERREPPISENEKIKKQIKKFVSQIDKLEKLPIPSPGDCWLCLCESQHPESPCDSLRMHLKENYLHGHLILCALKSSGYQDHQLPYVWQSKDIVKRALAKHLRKALIPTLAR